MRQLEYEIIPKLANISGNNYKITRAEVYPDPCQIYKMELFEKIAYS